MSPQRYMNVRSLDIRLTFSDNERVDGSMRKKKGMGRVGRYLIDFSSVRSDALYKSRVL